MTRVKLDQDFSRDVVLTLCMGTGQKRNQSPHQDQKGSHINVHEIGIYRLVLNFYKTQSPGLSIGHSL